jgi:hypothetical protein
MRVKKTAGRRKIPSPYTAKHEGGPDVQKCRLWRKKLKMAMKIEHGKKRGNKHRKGRGKRAKRLVAGLLTAGAIVTAGTGYVRALPAPAPAPSCVEVHLPVLGQDGDMS